MGIRSPPKGWTPASDSKWDEFLQKLRHRRGMCSEFWCDPNSLILLDERVFMGLIRPDFTNRWTTEEFLYRAWPSMPSMQTPRPPSTPAKRKRDDTADDAQQPPRRPLGILANGPPAAKKARGDKEAKKVKDLPGPAPTRNLRERRPRPA